MFLNVFLICPVVRIRPLITFAYFLKKVISSAFCANTVRYRLRCIVQFLLRLPDMEVSFEEDYVFGGSGLHWIWTGCGG
jgi:hypothetical protein